MVTRISWTPASHNCAICHAMASLPVLVLLHLSGKNISPDIPGCCAEAERHAVLAFLQLVNQFNSDKHPAGMLEPFEPRIADTRNLMRR